MIITLILFIVVAIIFVKNKKKSVKKIYRVKNKYGEVLEIGSKTNIGEIYCFKIVGNKIHATSLSQPFGFFSFILCLRFKVS